MLLFTCSLFGQPNDKIGSLNTSVQNKTIERDEGDILEKSGLEKDSDIDSLPDTESNSDEKPIIDKANAEDQADNIIEQKDQSEADKSSTEKEKPTTIIKRKPAANNDGLMEIKEGSFKYNRIPGISIKKERIINKDIAETQTIPETIPPAAESPEKEDNKGIFGFEKGIADTVVKILLICLIIGIIILFKFRSKRRNDKVLRRFPGV